MVTHEEVIRKYPGSVRCQFNMSVYLCVDAWLFMQRNLEKRPWMALYTGAIGGVSGCLFFMLSLWSRKIAGDGGCAPGHL